jgi:hypothetical protein
LIPFTKNVPLEDLNAYSVLKYISYLRERGFKSTKAFLKFLYEEGYLEENISAYFKIYFCNKLYKKW